MCVNNLPKVVTWQRFRPESILGSFGNQSGTPRAYRYTTKPHIVNSLRHNHNNRLGLFKPPARYITRRNALHIICTFYFSTSSRHV